jgi:murein DD-endopeptidase MepM/ murein hydrolase activator NlpD
MVACWPVPVAAPANPHETIGNFWEDRGDRHHCGIDIYASEGTEVVSIYDGQVSVIGLFTTPEQVRYWNQTYHIIINHGKRIFCRYAELSDLLVVSGQRVHAGQVIGHVGTVLNEDRIDDMVPGMYNN